MVTKYIDEVENKMIKFITQKYSVGTYVAVYVDDVIAEQFDSNDPRGPVP